MQPCSKVISAFFFCASFLPNSNGLTHGLRIPYEVINQRHLKCLGQMWQTYASAVTKNLGLGLILVRVLQAIFLSCIRPL